MSNFRTPTLEDKVWVDELLAGENGLACEYNFANIYLLSDAYHQTIARAGDRLLVRMEGGQGGGYLFPTGRGPLEGALKALEADAGSRGEGLHLICLTAEHRSQLEEVCPGRFVFEEDRDGFDYVYSTQRLATLAGKKLHGKRNHIHRFDETWPDWMFDPLGPDNLCHCAAMARRWFAQRLEEGGEDAADLEQESLAIQEALDGAVFARLGLEGGLIRAGGQVMAFSLGSPLGDNGYDIHFEKAFPQIQGAYTVINREMARMVARRHPRVEWINREDDLGLEGLRRAKLSYYPDILLTKYRAYLP